jgi:hypothetical protein
MAGGSEEIYCDVIASEHRVGFIGIARDRWAYVEYKAGDVIPPQKSDGLWCLRLNARVVSRCARKAQPSDKVPLWPRVLLSDVITTELLESLHSSSPPG